MMKLQMDGLPMQVMVRTIIVSRFDIMSPIILTYVRHQSKRCLRRHSEVITVDGLMIEMKLNLINASTQYEFKFSHIRKIGQILLEHKTKMWMNTQLFAC